MRASAPLHRGLSRFSAQPSLWAVDLQRTSAPASITGDYRLPRVGRDVAFTSANEYMSFAALRLRSDGGFEVRELLDPDHAG